MTLIELVMFIVIVSVGIAGILSVMNVVVKSSADPMVRKQAIAFADAVLEEVLTKAYCDPDHVPPTCTVSQEASRLLWDDVQDYNGKSIAGTDLLSGSSTALLAGYTATVAVADVSVAGTGVPGSTIVMKQVTVKVVGGGNDSYSISGYRANY